jgi:outer membrane protein
MTLSTHRRILNGLAAVCFVPLAHLAHAESLLDIYELALENDAQLKAQEAQYLANVERENIALSALLPQVSAGYGYTENKNESTSQQILGFSQIGVPVVGEGFNESDTNTDGWDVSLSQTLFDLSSWYNFKAGEEFSKQAEAEFAANTQNLIVRVVEAYFGVLRAQDNLAAAVAQEKAFERQLEQTRQRFEVGLIAITDVYESEAARDLAQVQRIVEENNVDVAKERLSVLTGQRHGNLFELSEAFSAKAPTPADRAAWVDFALANNNRLAAARFAEESAHQASKANQMEHAPKVTASYRYSDTETEGTRGADPEPLFLVQPESQQTQEVLQLRIDMPLFTGGRLSANRRRAEQEYIAARESRINLMRTTVTEARSLHMTVLSDVARVAARKQSIKSSQSALDATEAGYEVGTRNIVDVLNAQNVLFSAERDYANSRYDFIINSLRLKENAGTLSPDDVAHLDSFLKQPAAPTASSAR